MNRDARVANYLFLTFSILSVVLLALPLTGKVGAFRAFASYLLNPVPYYGDQAFDRISGIPADAARLINGDIELQRVQVELKEAKYLRLELESLKRENARLAAAVGVASSTIRSVRWARVMQRSPSNWHRSLIISAGLMDGIELNAPVMALSDGELGVVGRVIETSERVAKVRLVTDELSAIAAYFPEGQWEGLIQGQGTERLRMNYLPLAAHLKEGDRVYSSPTSATFEPDMFIGTVTKVFEKDPFLAFQSVEISPAVPGAMVKEVMILIPKRPEGI
jgi:rod shape-determining protein MreC